MIMLSYKAFVIDASNAAVAYANRSFQMLHHSLPNFEIHQTYSVLAFALLAMTTVLLLMLIGYLRYVMYMR